MFSNTHIARRKESNNDLLQIKTIEELLVIWLWNNTDKIVISYYYARDELFRANDFLMHDD